MTADRPNRGKTVAGYVGVMLFLGILWYGPVTQAAQVLLLGRRWDWGNAIVRGATQGVVFGLILAVAAALPDRDATRRALRRSIDSEDLPLDADPREWELLLRRQHTREKAARWLLPVMFGVEAALLAAVAGSTRETAWPLWAAATAAAVVAAACLGWDPSDRRVVERLRHQLAARDRPTG